MSLLIRRADTIKGESPVFWDSLFFACNAAVRWWDRLFFASLVIMVKPRLMYHVTLTTCRYRFQSIELGFLLLDQIVCQSNLFAVKVIVVGKVSLKLAKLMLQILFHSEPILW